MNTSANVSSESAHHVEPMQLADSGRIFVRSAQRVIGVALALAAVGVWVAPGAASGADVLSFKLILSLAAVLAGLGLLHASFAPRAPEVEIDTIRRQVRVVRREPGAVPHILQSCSFCQLSAAEFDGNLVRMWDDQNVLLAEVSPKDRTALRSLVAGLQDEGKLA